MVRETYSRRKALKLCAASGASGILLTKPTVAQQPDPEDIWEQGLQIREQTGSLKAFEEYVTNRGFNVEWQQTAAQTRRNGGGN